MVAKAKESNLVAKAYEASLDSQPTARYKSFCVSLNVFILTSRMNHAYR
jgi:hypothetical protein